jgi:hypothetical protein
MESTCHGGTKLARYNLIPMSLILGWEDLLSGLTGGRRSFVLVSVKMDG